MSDHKFPVNWKLSDGYPVPGITKHGKKVFTTFSCGGGSSMGYKLAGYDVIAAEDIDPFMQEIYQANHHPKHYFLQGIGDMIGKTDWPEDMKDLDVMDGSPPCSTFSISGLRDKAWGKEKKFREGQATQILDDLFFQFIAVAKELQPKVIIAENVKGMLLGNAKGYLVEIFKKLDEAGYNAQLFLLKASTMGVPQRRERVFFVASRKDLNLPPITLEFNETPITYGEIRTTEGVSMRMSETTRKYWDKRGPRDRTQSQASFRMVGKESRFNWTFARNEDVLPTIPAHAYLVVFDEPRMLTSVEVIRGGSFPEDFNFIKPGYATVSYIVGMSVPPIMMAQVANQVYEQWLSKLP